MGICIVSREPDEVGFRLFNSEYQLHNALTKSEELKMLIGIQKGDQQARDEFIESNLRLVLTVVRKFGSHNIDIEELTSVGTMGLIKAVDSFKKDRGFKFSTYGSRCIENEILMYFNKNNKYIKNKSLDTSSYISREQIDNSNLIDILVGNRGKSAVDEMSKKEEYTIIKKEMKKILTGQELKILNYYFGLKGRGPMTQLKISKKIGYSQSYINKTKAKSINKLRNNKKIMEILKNQLTM